MDLNNPMEMLNPSESQWLRNSESLSSEMGINLLLRSTRLSTLKKLLHTPLDYTAMRSLSADDRRILKRIKKSIETSIPITLAGMSLLSYHLTVKMYGPSTCRLMTGMLQL